MTLWSTLKNKLQWNHAQYELASALAAEWKEKGYIHKTCLEMLTLENEVIILFYAFLGNGEPIVSPIMNKQDSSWMLDSDFCFINIRATGLNENYGDFLQAAKLLPVIRANAIHLGPFTSYDFGTIYAVTSTKTISKNVVNHTLWEKGIYPEEQLKLFVQACHMLGKCVGFDLEPHVSQFAKVVLEHPQYFRWIALNENHSIKANLSQEEQIEKNNQKAICQNIQKIVNKRLAQEKLKTLESEYGDTLEIYNRKENIYFELISEIIKNGYWTIPSHTWGGIGVPAYDGYNTEGNYAKFLYLDKHGNNQNDSAYDIVTPFQFYYNLKVNKVTQPISDLQLNTEVVDYYSNIFTYWRDEFEFDFVRHDSLDHIFDSVDKDGNPLSDRITPSILKICNEKSKSPNKNFIGNLAERMGYEYEEYNNSEFDLLLGNEAMESITSDFIERQFAINENLAMYNAEKPKTSCVFATDTHDTGSPHLWGQPLLHKAGIDGMRVRHFVSRFMPTGASYRPKYEVMGVQDLSYGLFESNITDKNLNWVGNVHFNKVYHYIEDVFESVKAVMQKGSLVEKHVDWNYCWWIIRHNNHILIPVFSTENGSGCDYFHIMLKDKLHNIKKIEVHDFYKCEKFTVNNSFNEIKIYNLSHKQCLLYEIKTI